MDTAHNTGHNRGVGYDPNTDRCDICEDVTDLAVTGRYRVCWYCAEDGELNPGHEAGER